MSIIYALIATAAIITLLNQFNTSYSPLPVNNNEAIYTTVSECNEHLTFMGCELRVRTIMGIYRRESDLVDWGTCDADMVFEMNPHGRWIIDGNETRRYKSTQKIPQDKIAH